MQPLNYLSKCFSSSSTVPSSGHIYTVLGPKPRLTKTDESRVRKDSWWIDVLISFFNSDDAVALTGNSYKASIHQALCISEPFAASRMRYP